MKKIAHCRVGGMKCQIWDTFSEQKKTKKGPDVSIGIILAVESYTTIIISMPHFSFLKGWRLFILQNTPHSIFLLASRKPSTMHTSAIEKEGHKSGSKNSLSHARCVFIHVEGGGLYCHLPRAAHRGFLAAPPSAAGLVT